MSTHLNIGTSDLPYDRQRYFEDFSLVEHRIGMVNPPNPATLRKWASAAPEGFRHIWVAWQSFTFPADKIRAGSSVELLPEERARNLGNFQDTDENRRVWRMVLDAVEAIGADTILFETHSSLVPSDANRALMRAFVSDWAELPEGIKIAWQPSGFWEREEILALTDELGWLAAIDPLVEPGAPLPSGTSAYFRMLGAHGLGNKYSDDALDRLLELVEPFEDVTVVFRTDDSVSDASRFKKYAEVMGI